MPELGNVAEGKGQAEAQLQCGYGAITLRREGDDAIVEIDYRGRQIEVIRTFLDSNFCDTIYPIGMVDTIKREIQVDELTL